MTESPEDKIKWFTEQKESLTKLGERLNYEFLFAKQIVDKSTNPEIEKKWMSGVSSVCNFSLFQINNLIESLGNYQHAPKEQIGYYIGKTAIVPFIDIINCYELSMNQLIQENPKLNKLIQDRIDKHIEKLENIWKLDLNRKGRKIQKDIRKMYQRKITEMSFIRETLKNNNLIDQLDFDILKFSWDIRNSMHNNYCAIVDIDFSYPDIKTGKRYYYSYKKGEELSHPENDLVSYYVIMEQIIHIHFKTLQKFRG
jgi:hypothetical protein